jgi:hypothetical protein
MNFAASVQSDNKGKREAASEIPSRTKIKGAKNDNR